MNHFLSRNKFFTPKNLRSRFLQYILQKDDNRGFARDELLIPLIMAGIVVVVAWSNFVDTTPIPRISEAKQYVSSMNKKQQAYFVENSDFSNSVSQLGVGILSQTENYRYSTLATANAAFNYGTPRKASLKSYVGGVFAVPLKNVAATAKEEMMTIAILCEAKSPGRTLPAKPTYKNGVLACGAQTTEVLE